MALIIEIKVNHTKLFTLAAERFPNTPPEGLNPYRVKVFDAEGCLLRESSLVHQYEDGPIKLAERITKEFQNIK